MFYNSLKIIHILSAAGLLTGIFLCIRQWFLAQESTSTLKFMQLQTALLIVPLAFLQLISGFTMISLQHYAWSELWVKTSILGFLIVMLTWIGFIFLPRLRTLLLTTCLLTLLGMIFMMANKIV